MFQYSIIFSICTELNKAFWIMKVKCLEDLLSPLWPTWGLRCPWGHSTIGAERWPSPHAPLSGQSTRSCPPLPCHHHWACGCCVSAAGWQPVRAAAVCASATAQNCFLSFAGSTERKQQEEVSGEASFHPNVYIQGPQPVIVFYFGLTNYFIEKFNSQIIIYRNGKLK